MTDTLVRNAHTAPVAKIPPGQKGRVAAWLVAPGSPYLAYLRPLEPPKAPEVEDLKATEAEPPKATEAEESAREAREAIRHAKTVEDLERYLQDHRSSVQDAARKKALRLSGLSEGDSEPEAVPPLPVG